MQVMSFSKNIIWGTKNALMHYYTLRNDGLIALSPKRDFLEDVCGEHDSGAAAQLKS